VIWLRAKESHLPFVQAYETCEPLLLYARDNLLVQKRLVVDSHHSLRLFRPTLEALSATQPDNESQERESNPRTLVYESNGEARFHPAL
jgi:hypothetical protein